jgi:hypothetical protein
MLLKRAAKGRLPLLAAAQRLQDEILSGPSMDLEDDESPLAEEKRLASNAKKVALMVVGMAAQKFSTGLERQQMVLTWAADIIIDTFLMDSAIGRTAKLVARDGVDKYESAVDATRLFVNDAIGRIDLAAKNALAATVEGDELRVLLAALRRWTKYTPFNTAAVRERLADRVVAAGGTCFRDCRGRLASHLENVKIEAADQRHPHPVRDAEGSPSEARPGLPSEEGLRPAGARAGSRLTNVLLASLQDGFFGPDSEAALRLLIPADAEYPEILDSLLRLPLQSSLIRME